MYQVIAHRGFSSIAPENTLASLQKAIDSQVDCIEFDVRFCKEGTPILFHDETLERLALSSERIDALSVKELKQYDIGSWFCKTFASERIPTLKEALALKRDSTHYMLEVKPTQLQPELAAATILSEIQGHRNIFLASFDHQILDAFQKLDPSWPLLGLIEDEKGYQGFADRGMKHLVFDYQLLTNDRIATLRECGHTVWCYTVDDPQVKEQLSMANIHGIITNSPVAR